MESERHIDARGMACPRPIIELAKLRRHLCPGARIRILADDLAFESDVRAWCDATGNPLLSLERDGAAIEALIDVRVGRAP